MTEQHGNGNVLGDAVGATTQIAAQLATIAATAAQTVLRVRAQRLAAHQAQDQATIEAERAALRTEHATARLAWAPALERDFPASASAAEAATVWAAAQPWTGHDPTARAAADKAEQRLAGLYPHLIVRYEQRLADGLDSIDAMADAAIVLDPADPNAARAAWGVAGDERAEAQAGVAAPDLTATATVDEHSHGVQAAAQHAAVADGAHARAALLAAQAYPHPVRAALTGPTRPASTRPRSVRSAQPSRYR